MSCCIVKGIHFRVSALSPQASSRVCKPCHFRPPWLLNLAGSGRGDREQTHLGSMHTSENTLLAHTHTHSTYVLHTPSAHTNVSFCIMRYAQRTCLMPISICAAPKQLLQITLHTRLAATCRKWAHGQHPHLLHTTHADMVALQTGTLHTGTLQTGTLTQAHYRQAHSHGGMMSVWSVTSSRAPTSTDTDCRTFSVKRLACNSSTSCGVIKKGGGASGRSGKEETPPPSLPHPQTQHTMPCM